MDKGASHEGREARGQGQGLAAPRRIGTQNGGSATEAQVVGPTDSAHRAELKARLVRCPYGGKGVRFQSPSFRLDSLFGAQSGAIIDFKPGDGAAVGSA